MKSEHDTLEQLSLAREIRMSPKQKRDLWGNIEREMPRVKSQPAPRRRSRHLAGSTAAVAAAVVVAAGIYGVTSHGTRHSGRTELEGSQSNLMSTAYRAPDAVEGISVASDGGLLCFPTNTADVTQKVYAWLHSATPSTTVPSHAGSGPFTQEIGRASFLSFTDDHGAQVTVYPAYSLVDHTIPGLPGLVSSGASYVPNVIAYKVGNQVSYLKSPELYTWLKQDQWQSEFELESYTEVESKAIQAVFSSPQWGLFQGLFPAKPGVAAVQIPHGGASTTPPLQGSCTTQAHEVGSNVKVTLYETWNTGKGQHTWTFIVGPDGKILSHTESGNIAPQFWK